jgi:SAM-dependent methyltransferase
MAATHPNLRLWAGDAADVLAEPPSDGPQEAADRLYEHEAFRAPAVSAGAPGRGGPAAEPYTLPWFEQIERQRYGRHGYWIPKVLEFSRHGGETLLGLGEGLGTDWLQYARNGTHVIACSPSQEQLGLVRRNFELRGLSARILHAPPHGLPLDSASVDVVCVQGLLHELDRPAAVIDEVYRVLRPGGKVLVVAPARYDAAYWYDACFPWRRWFRRGRPERDSAATGRSLRTAFGRFVEHKVYKRHLRRSQLPPLWRFGPLPLLERLFGQVLVLKAFKPLSAALTTVALAA